LKGIRNFANKIWNASRFVMMNLDDDAAYVAVDPDTAKQTLADRWIMSRCQEVTGEVDRLLKRYDIGEAGRTLYDFIWNEFCDWYIELAKPRLYNKDNENDRRLVQHILWYVLQRTMQLLHPFMPFITEEIWQNLAHQGDTIMNSQWPELQKKWINPQAVTEMNLLMNIVKAVRNIRVEMGVGPGPKIEVILRGKTDSEVALLSDNRAMLEKIAGLAKLTIEQIQAEKPGQAMTAIVGPVEVYVPLKGLIDKEKEIARLAKELATAESELDRVNKKLSNQGFLAKAPPDVVAKEESKQTEYAETAEKIRERIQQIEDL
jgi:valyl-tRNA synthetase